MREVYFFFDSFGLGDSYCDTFELTYSKVGHPGSGKNDQFYATAVSLGIIASPLKIPGTTFDSALADNHYVMAGDFKVLSSTDCSSKILYTIQG